jgi:putative membrane protein
MLPAVTAFLVRLVVTAVTLWIAELLVDGIAVEGGTSTARAVTLLGVALVFGVLNAVLRPLLTLVTLPLFLLTLGLFTFVVNAVMLLLTSWAAGQLGLPFLVDGFGSAVLGAVVVSLASFAFNVVLPDRYER